LSADDKGGCRGEAGAKERPGNEVKPLKIGDRVRIKAGRRIPCYQSGDRGTVWRGPVTSAAGTAYYLLTMDRDGGRNAIFTTNEIEPDV
jgi:hypothetical protein